MGKDEEATSGFLLLGKVLPSPEPSSPTAVFQCLSTLRGAKNGSVHFHVCFQPMWIHMQSVSLQSM